MRIAIVLCAVLLAGCQTTRYAPTYCVGKDQKLPSEPPYISDKLNGNAEHDIKPIAGSAKELRAWGQGLRTILEGCREPR